VPCPLALRNNPGPPGRPLELVDAPSLHTRSTSTPMGRPRCRERLSLISPTSLLERLTLTSGVRLALGDWAQDGSDWPGIGDASAPQSVVVVGIDGSAGADEALRWALAEAQLRRRALRLVHAWEVGYSGLFEGGSAFLDGTPDTVSSPGFNVVHRAAEGLLERVLERVGMPSASVAIECLNVEGPPADVLVGAVRQGDLLVVGSRGHSGFGELMRDSVSQLCARRAPCPVVVVRTGARCASAPVATFGVNIA